MKRSRPTLSCMLTRSIALPAAATVLNVWLLAMAATQAGAAEITFLCAAALRPPMAELIPAFERVSGHKLVVSYGNVGALTDRIRKGAAVDVAIVAPDQVEALVKQGKIRAGGINIAKVGLGMAVNKGAPKPDISSLEAFKAVLRKASSIGYNDPATGSPAGIHIARLAEQLGLAGELNPKTRLNGGSLPTFEALSKGEIDIGFAMVNQIMEDQRVDLVGPLPGEIQDTTIFSAAIGVGAVDAQASKALVDFLVSPAAAAVFKARGLGLD
jgi:molybdate transport system substrate-binding protein